MTAGRLTYPLITVAAVSAGVPVARVAFTHETDYGLGPVGA